LQTLRIYLQRRVLQRSISLSLSLSLLPRHGDKKQGLKRWLEEQ
jgi:hypothetical protein